MESMEPEDREAAKKYMQGLLEQYRNLQYAGAGGIPGLPEMILNQITLAQDLLFWMMNDGEFDSRDRSLRAPFAQGGYGISERSHYPNPGPQSSEERIGIVSTEFREEPRERFERVVEISPPPVWARGNPVVNVLSFVEETASALFDANYRVRYVDTVVTTTEHVRYSRQALLVTNVYLDDQFIGTIAVDGPVPREFIDRETTVTVIPGDDGNLVHISRVPFEEQ